MADTNGTSEEVLGINPSELKGYSIDEIKNFIVDVQKGLASSEPRMTEDEITDAAKNIFKEANE